MRVLKKDISYVTYDINYMMNSKLYRVEQEDY